jgi:hypothetical protein
MINAVTSAVMTGVVSLLIAPRKTIWERRAQGREEARNALREVVQPMHAKVIRCRAGLLRMDRQENRLDTSYFELVSRVLDVAERLHPLRRLLVQRRPRRLFGPFIARVAAVTPMHDGNWLGALMALHTAGADPRPLGLTDEDARFGLLHLALLPDAPPAHLGRLETELGRLAAGW